MRAVNTILLACFLASLHNGVCELIFLGKIKHSSPDGSLRASDYFVSSDTANWVNAETACHSFGFTGLASIESIDEWNNLVKLLADYGNVKTYWTDGVWGGARWIWSSNGHPLPTTWVQWEPGHPTQVNQFVYSTAISYMNNRVNPWVTLQSSQFHHYICETPSATEPVPCDTSNDLVIVLDSSGSIGPDDFEIALDFVARLAVAYLENINTRFSLIRYSTTADVIIPLQNAFGPDEIKRLVMNTTYLGGNTYTNAGINLAHQQTTQGFRNMPQNMVVLTDGASTDPALTREAALQIIASGVRTFSVGISDEVNYSELLVIAGGDEKSVFQPTDFNRLLEYLRPVSLRVCEE